MHFEATWYANEKHNADDHHDNGVGDVDSLCQSGEASRSLRWIESEAWTGIILPAAAIS